MFTGYTGTLDATFATDTQLANTGTTLVSSINSLSGYINSSSSNIVFTTGNQIISGVKTFVQDATFGDTGQGDFLVISGNNFTVYGSGNFTSGLFVNSSPVLTGSSTLYATSVNLASTGSTLDTKINNLSGYINSTGSNIVLTTGNQSISGVKTFNNGLSTSHISGIFGSTLNIIAGSGVGPSSINASDLILIGGSLSGVAPNILKTGASITLGGAKTTATADITIRPSVDQNASAGNIILEAGLSPTYNGKINMFGDINVNGTSDIGTPLSSKNINIYRRGDLFGSPSQRLAISIDNNNVNFQNGMGLQVSGVQVTPSLYATSANLASTGSTLDTKINNLSGYVNSTSSNIVFTTGDQTINGLKTFANTGSFDTLQITNKKLSSYSYNSSNFIFGNTYINIVNSSNNIIGTLPSGITSGINYYVKNLNTGILLITGSGQRTIDGFSNINLYKNESLQLLGVNNVGYTGWVTLSADNGVS